jgi:Fe-S-cluster containining protein
MVSPPFLGPADPEWDRLNRERPDLVAGILHDRRMRWANKDDGDDYPCLWLDRETGRCRHYEYRPEVCRDFEPGSEECRKFRSRFGLDA